MAEKTRDGWDKLDVIAKLLSGVFLGALSLAVGLGAREIADAQKTGELVRSLITDLTSEDKRTRQDLALIALDHAASKQDPELVAEIAERILLDFRSDSLAQVHDLTNSVAFRVLEKRDASRAKRLRDSAETKAGRLQRTSISFWDTTKVKQEVVAPEARLLPSVTGNVVYIQFKSPQSRQLMERIRAVLKSNGFSAPGTEQIAGNYRSWVRYFHEEDRDLAERVAELVRTELKSAAPSDFTAQGVFNQKFRAPRGQLELWLDM